jgi:hypothetical protein
MPIVVIDKKKKKDEDEELSPYKVYSYVGYTENDYHPIAYPNQIYFANPNYSYLYYNPPCINPVDSLKVDDKDKDKDKEKDSEQYSISTPIPGVEYIDSNNIITKATINTKDTTTYNLIKQKYEAQIKPIMQEIMKNKKDVIIHQNSSAEYIDYNVKSKESATYYMIKQKYEAEIKPLVQGIIKNKKTLKLEKLNETNEPDEPLV